MPERMGPVVRGRGIVPRPPHVAEPRQAGWAPASGREGRRAAGQKPFRTGHQKSVVEVVLVEVDVADEAVELEEVDVLVVLEVVVTQSTSGASTSWQSPHALQRWR